MPIANPEETWKQITFKEKARPRKNYYVSNYGRIATCKQGMEDRKILKGSVIGGYPAMKIRINHHDKTFYIHRLVGDYFIEGKSEASDSLIHLDYDKKNNCTNNLKWVPRKQSLEHNRKNPAVIAAKERQAGFRPDVGHKLTSTDVMRMKKMIWDPNRKTRLRLIARQFGISEMQLYRIKSGENWSHVRVANEPEKTGEKKRKDFN